jgi:hypothetical protein
MESPINRTKPTYVKEPRTRKSSKNRTQSRTQEERIELDKLSDEELGHALLSTRLEETKQKCKQRRNACKGLFWLLKAKAQYGEEPKDFYNYQDNYYNYLAARVRGINRQIKGLLKFPNLTPQDFHMEINQLYELNIDDLKKIASSIDIEFERKGFKAIYLSDEETEANLIRRIKRYFETVQDRFEEIPILSELAENTSLEIAEYLRETFPNKFKYVEATKEKLFPVERRPISPGFYPDKEDFVVLRTPYDQLEVIFATYAVNPPEIEVVQYSNGRIEGLPSLFEEFLQRMGLTYRAAGELYGTNFRSLTRRHDWL